MRIRSSSEDGASTVLLNDFNSAVLQPHSLPKRIARSRLYVVEQVLNESEVIIEHDRLESFHSYQLRSCVVTSTGDRVAHHRVRLKRYRSLLAGEFVTERFASDCIQEERFDASLSRLFL